MLMLINNGAAVRCTDPHCFTLPCLRSLAAQGPDSAQQPATSDDDGDGAASAMAQQKRAQSAPALKGVCSSPCPQLSCELLIWDCATLM
jgi:hypothetical protein